MPILVVGLYIDLTNTLLSICYIFPSLVSTANHTPLAHDMTNYNHGSLYNDDYTAILMSTPWYLACPENFKYDPHSQARPSSHGLCLAIYCNHHHCHCHRKCLHILYHICCRLPESGTHHHVCVAKPITPTTP